MKSRRFRFALSAAAAIFICLLLVGAGTQSQAVANQTASNNAVIYLYDPSTSQFIFSYDLVSQFSDVRDIVVYRNGSVYQVWFTIQDGDQIGRLNYTNPSTYDLVLYDLPVSSGPLNLIYTNGAVWFTAPKGNYVGKLNPVSGAVTQVALPTPKSMPADLVAASDGSIWFTEYNTGRLGHITGTSTYTLAEIEKTGWASGKPYGITMGQYGALYFSQTALDQVIYYQPLDGGSVAISFLDRPNHPYRMTTDKLGRAWGTVLGGNAIAMFAFDTLPIVNQYPLTPTASYPVAIDVDSNNILWYAQEFANQIGWLNASQLYASTNPISLPNAQDVPVGIAVDTLNRVWVLVQSDTLVDVYLPVNAYNSATSP